jgi:hypothetical protein
MSKNIIFELIHVNNIDRNEASYLPQARCLLCRNNSLSGHNIITSKLHVVFE